MEGDCEHKFVYAGVRYADGANERPGSGARNRYYAHVYFCERCLEKRSERIDAGDQHTYNKPLWGATPGAKEEVGVPEHDKTFRRSPW